MRHAPVRTRGISSPAAPAHTTLMQAPIREKTTPASETRDFQEFEDRVNELLRSDDFDPAFRIFTFYDEGIIPSGSANAAPRTTRPVGGESPLEMIYNFFCGRQQPTAGEGSFDDLAANNLSMSFPELIKCSSMMFTGKRSMHLHFCLVHTGVLSSQKCHIAVLF